MGLLSRGKKSAQQQKLSKYLVNVKDKKFRKYLDERFDGLAGKEELAKIFDEMNWARIKNRIDSMPAKERYKMLQVLVKYKEKLDPIVKQNFVRYMLERYGVRVEK